MLACCAAGQATAKNSAETVAARHAHSPDCYAALNGLENANRLAVEIAKQLNAGELRGWAGNGEE